MFDDNDDYDNNEYDNEYEEDKDDNEYEDRYEYDIAEFVYKDYNRIGMADDEYLEIPLGTDTDGIKLDPDLKFKLELKKFLDEEKRALQLSELEVGDIKKQANQIPFIQYKNPILLILGYYVYAKVKPELGEERFQSHLNVVNTYLRQDGIFTMFDVIKYARYWKNIQN